MPRKVKIQRPKAIAMRELFDPRKMRAWRVRRNMSQGELAERMGWDFVSGGSCVSRYETAPFRKRKQLPSKGTLDLVAAALNIDVGQLLSSESELLDSIRLLFEERRARPQGSRRHRQRQIFDELVLQAKRESGQELLDSIEDLEELRSLAKRLTITDGDGKSVTVEVSEEDVEDLNEGEFDKVVFSDANDGQDTA